MVIIHEDLHNFLADLWNSAEETGGNNRFFRPLSCWLESCTYDELPDYMKSEYDRGRIIIYPLFPKNKCKDMGYDRKVVLNQIKKSQKKQEKTSSRFKKRISEFIYDHF